MSGIKVKATAVAEKKPDPMLRDLTYGTVFLYNHTLHMKIQVDGKPGMLVNLENGNAFSIHQDIKIRTVVELHCEVQAVDSSFYLNHRVSVKDEGVHFKIHGAFAPETVEEDEEDDRDYNATKPRRKRNIRSSMDETMALVEPEPAPPKEE